MHVDIFFVSELPIEICALDVNLVKFHVVMGS